MAKSRRQHAALLPILGAVAICALFTITLLYSPDEGTDASDIAFDADVNRTINWPDDNAGEDTAAGIKDESPLAHPQTAYGEDGEAFAANQVLMSFNGAITEKQIVSLLAGDGIQAQEVSLVSNMLEGNDVLVQIAYANDLSPREVADRVASHPCIASAEPNYARMLCETGDVPAQALASESEGSADEPIAQLASTTNDEYLSQQWGLSAVGAQNAWDVARSDGNVTVAVLDSGVDVNHPDLAPNLILGQYAYNAASKTYGASAVEDINGHGTHVAGIAAAVSNNARGVSGVSYNARVLPVRISNDSGGSSYVSDEVRGLDYVTRMKQDASSPQELRNIRVINLSIGSYDYSTSEYGAVSRATAANILVVAAAGNDSRRNSFYPACYSGVMSVTALRQYSGTSVTFDNNYSNYGVDVDISAPGTNIYSTYPSSTYQDLTGTSMASPMVAGAAALVYSKRMDAKPSEIEGFLESTARDLGTSGRDNYYGYGALRVDEALYLATNHLCKSSIARIPDQVAYGDPLTPSITLTLRGTVLQEGVDYTLSYADNVAPGTATVVATGIGSCSGTQSATFKIISPNLADAAIEIGDQPFTGAPIEPTLSVMHDGHQLVAGVHYQATFSNNTQVGTAKVHLEGIGYCTGSADATFAIVKRSIDDATIADIEEQRYTGSNIRPAITVTLGDYELEEGRDFRASYNAKDPGTGSVTITGINAFTGSATKYFQVTEFVERPQEPIQREYIDQQKYLRYLGYHIYQRAMPESESYTLSGNYRKYDVGTYQFTVTLADNRKWEDGTSDPLTLTWQIVPLHVAIPQGKTDLTFDGTSQYGFDYDTRNNSYYRLNGTLEAIEEGTYTATASLTSTKCYQWDDDTNEDKEITWQIKPGYVLNTPEAVTGLVYNGKEQTGVPNGRGYTVEGGYATKAGIYTATVTPQSGFTWLDGTTEPVDITWSIAKKPIPKPTYTTEYTGEPQVAFGGIKAQHSSYLTDIMESESFSAGWNTSAAVLSDGSLWMWGENREGMITGESGTKTTEPTKVMDDVTSVSLGKRVGALVLKRDKSVWMFDSKSLTYKQVLTGVEQAYAGHGSYAAIKTDGTLWMWGVNGMGQLGIGSTYDSASPKFVLDNVASVALFSEHTAAVKNDGTLWMWGSNLGLNPSSSLKPVKALDGVKSVSVNDKVTAIITTDDELWMWEGTTKPNKDFDYRRKVMDNVSSVALNWTGGAAVTNDHVLKAWTDDPESSATVANEVSQVSLGYSCALYSDTSGTLHSFGCSGGTYDDTVTPSIAKGQSQRFDYIDESGTVLISGSTWPSDAGTYTALIAPADESYCWDDGSREFCSAEWQIAPKKIEPTDAVATGLRYAGEEQTGIVEGNGIVFSSGVMSAREIGTYEAWVQLESDNYQWADGSTGAKKVTWTIDKGLCDLSDVSFDDASLAYDGESHSLTLEGELPDGVSVTYEGGGKVDAGSYPITAKFEVEDLEHYEPIDDWVATLTIEPADITDADFSELPDQILSDQPSTPGIEATFKGKALVQGTDYTLGYAHNARTGTATAIVTGMGNFKDTAEIPFSIVPDPDKIDISGARIIMDDALFVGNQDGQTNAAPRIRVVLDGKELAEGVDFRVLYEDNSHPGWATVVANGTGTYTGSATHEFAIFSEPGEEALADAAPLALDGAADLTVGNLSSSTCRFDIARNAVVKLSLSVESDDPTDDECAYAQLKTVDGKLIGQWPIGQGEQSANEAGPWVLPAGAYYVTVYCGKACHVRVTCTDLSADYPEIVDATVEDALLAPPSDSSDSGTENGADLGEAMRTAKPFPFGGRFAGSIYSLFDAWRNFGLDCFKFIAPWNGSYRVVFHSTGPLRYRLLDERGTVLADSHRAASYAASVPSDGKSLDGAVKSRVQALAQTQTLDFEGLTAGATYYVAISAASAEHAAIGEPLDTQSQLYWGEVELTERYLVAVEPPVPADSVYDGALHLGVAPSEGYTLDGTAEASAVGNYSVVATLQDGYKWSNGSTEPIELRWSILAPPETPAQSADMHRLYNPNSGEHFYTASAYERDQLRRVGWRYEGVGWHAPVEGADVYRLYNPNAGDHHYTTSAYERDQLQRVGWRYEGVGWKSDPNEGVALYRQYNPNARAGSHNYTTSRAENDMLVRAGWRPEGIAWYGV